MILDEFESIDLTEQNLLEDVRTLDFINYQIADLMRRKEKLEENIKQNIGHDTYGARTYVIDRFSVMVKTGINFSIDKEEYAALRNHIPDCFNPVKEIVKLDIDKQVIKQIDVYASDEEKEKVNKFLKRKDAKLYVKINAAV